MIRYSAATALVLLLAGCGGQIEVPVIGRLSNGSKASGEAISKFNGEGTFVFQMPGNGRCEAGFDSLNRQDSLTIAVTCSDGRRGEAIVTRQLDRVSGTVIVTLNDGSRGQFVFGNLLYENYFGRDGTMAANPGG